MYFRNEDLFGGAALVINRHTTMAKYEFSVEMSCSGCSNAINRVLNRLQGVTKVDISLEEQKVLVETDDSVDYQTVYDTIAKTGKKINSGKTL